MRRSPRSFLAFAAALVVALMTVFVVASDLRSLHQRARDLGTPRRITVATHALSLGSVVRASDVRVVTRYASTVPNDAADARAVLGRVVAVPVAEGAVLQRAHLAASDRDGLTGLVPEGHRAIGIHTDDGMEPPRGAVVDVIAALDPSIAGGEAAFSAVTVARAARVLAVDDAADVQNTQGRGTGVTLLVTEDEAHTVAFAAANGILTLALAPPEAACC